MRLIIAEKPSVARAIASSIGSPRSGTGFAISVMATWEIFKNALLMLLIDLGVLISQPGYGSASAPDQAE